MTMYAIVRVRGSVNVSPKTKKTFEYLNLDRVNSMSIWPENEPTLRMIKMVENYSTFGKISEEMIIQVLEKRGKAVTGKIDSKKVLAGIKAGKTFNELGIVNCFRLSPPRKGYERKGIKKPFNQGGALGNRKDKIDDLIKRMI